MFGSVLNMPRVLNMPWFWICLSQNMRKFHFLKIRGIFLRKYEKNKLLQNIFFSKKYKTFFSEKIFEEWGRKQNALGSFFFLLLFFVLFCLFLAKHSIVDAWQCSEYTSGYKYAIVLNMPNMAFLKHMKVLFSEN